jgi:hemerythrin-like domain-containing protein
MASTQPDAYSRKSWEAVAESLSGSSASEHPVLATLYAEHRYMATLMKLLSAQLDLLEQGDDVDTRVLYESLHYMTHYPDAFHHPREDMVYQRAGELDPKVADSVDTLQRDHDYLAKLGQEALEAVEGWKDAALDAKAVLKPSREYIQSMYRHMNVEEKVVFPEIERLLTPEDWRELEQEDLIEPVADPVFGPRVSREYRNLARKARRALRRGVEDAALMEWIGLETVLEGLEVLSIAAEQGRAAARDHISEAGSDTRELISDSFREGGVLLLPLRCTMNTTGHYLSFLKDLGGIAREAGADLAELRSGASERMRMVSSQATSSSRN